MSTTKYYEISKGNLEKGIEKCYQNICNLLNSSSVIMGNKYNHNPISLGLYVFAIEEYGKLLYLIDMYRGKKLSEEEVHKIFGKPGGHGKKFAKAMENLDLKKCCNPIFGVIGINEKGQEWEFITHRGNKIKINGKKFYQPISDYIDNQLRARCFYTEWDFQNKNWANNPSIIEGFDYAVYEFEKTVNEKFCEFNDSKTS